VIDHGHAVNGQHNELWQSILTISNTACPTACCGAAMAAEDSHPNTIRKIEVVYAIRNVCLCSDGYRRTESEEKS
jgi:hypothetical protein